MTADRAVRSEEKPARLTVVVLTFNRVDQVLDTLAKLAALPDRFDIVAVDNASTDGDGCAHRCGLSLHYARRRAG